MAYKLKSKMTGSGHLGFFFQFS